MAQEEHIVSSSHSGSGGGDSGGGGGVSSDYSKNVKQKRVPQRGLGVAQLEKIRLEEEGKREALGAANVLANNAIGSVNDASPCLAVQSPTNFPSPNALYRSLPIQITNQLLWNCEYNLEGQRLRNDHFGVAIRTQGNLPLESNIPPPRSYRFQRPSSPVVNTSLEISPSSLLSCRMEPPSNQIVHGNNYTPSWPDEYKMVGMKRSYPFSLESSPAHSFPGNFDPTSAASRSRPDELASCSSGSITQMEPRNKYIRDGPSNPSPLPEQHPGEISRDDGRLNGEFLTLAPPSAALPPSNSKQKHPWDYSGPAPDFKCLPTQENLGSQIHHSRPSRSREEPFSFFPVWSEIDQTAAHLTIGNEGKGETIDLNLKL